jgi:predicted Zn-ribbon and HTH transcriptional regulator
LTDAMLKAFAKPIKFKDNCTKCGFSLPAYKGKYPKNCPSCNTDMSTNVKPDNNGKD